MTVGIWVRPGNRGWEVYVETPDGREFLRGTRRSRVEARRLAEREARWWQRFNLPVRMLEAGEPSLEAAGRKSKV
ncbi:MAG: hypothetical protein AB1609_22065 [Bacillota bacterium]